MDPITIGIIVATTVLASVGVGVGVKIYHSKKLNEKHKEWQKKQKAYQKEIDRLRKICEELEELIQELLRKRAEQDAKLKEEVAKRDMILKIIEELERRLHSKNSDGAAGLYAAITSTTREIAATLGKKPFSHEAELVAMYETATKECNELIKITSTITASSTLPIIESVATRVSDTHLIESCVETSQKLLITAKGGV